jgi:hypothetical protein
MKPVFISISSLNAFTGSSYFVDKDESGETDGDGERLLDEVVVTGENDLTELDETDVEGLLSNILQYRLPKDRWKCSSTKGSAVDSAKKTFHLVSILVYVNKVSLVKPVMIVISRIGLVSSSPRHLQRGGQPMSGLVEVTAKLDDLLDDS